MEITLIIVAGVVVITLIAMVGDHLTRTKLAQAARPPENVEALTQRIERLEQLVHDQQAKLGQLDADVAFTTKLLEKKE